MQSVPRDFDMESMTDAEAGGGGEHGALRGAGLAGIVRVVCGCVWEGGGRRG